MFLNKKSLNIYLSIIQFNKFVYLVNKRNILNAFYYLNNIHFFHNNLLKLVQKLFLKSWLLWWLLFNLQTVQGLWVCQVLLFY